MMSSDTLFDSQYLGNVSLPYIVDIDLPASIHWHLNMYNAVLFVVRVLTSYIQQSCNTDTCISALARCRDSVIVQHIVKQFQ